MADETAVPLSVGDGPEMSLQEAWTTMNDLSAQDQDLQPLDEEEKDVASPKQKKTDHKLPAEGDEETAEEGDEETAIDDDEDASGEGDDGATEDDSADWDKSDDDEEIAASAGGQYTSPKAKVKLPDGSEVRVADLIENGMQRSEYVQSMQALTQERQQIAALAQYNAQQAQQLEQTVNLALNYVAAHVPPEPSDEMWETDFFGAQAQQRQRDKAIGELTALQETTQAWQQQTAARTQQEQYQNFQRHQLNELNALLTKMPTLQDPAKAAAFARDITEGAAAYGFSPQELQVTDHRLLVMAADALRYRRLKANRVDASNRGRVASQAGTANAQKRTQAPMTTPGRRGSQGTIASQQEKKLEARLNQTGDIMDAAMLLTARQQRQKKAG